MPGRERMHTLTLTRDTDERWTPELVSYWQRAGDRIGEETPSVAAPSNAGNVQVRAVRVRPAITASNHMEDLNIVVQRLESSDPRERFRPHHRHQRSRLLRRVRTVPRASQPGEDAAARRPSPLEQPSLRAAGHADECDRSTPTSPTLTPAMAIASSGTSGNDSRCLVVAKRLSSPRFKPIRSAMTCRSAASPTTR